jgi:hypothetical protein
VFDLRRLSWYEILRNKVLRKLKGGGKMLAKTVVFACVIVLAVPVLVGGSEGWEAEFMYYTAEPDPIDGSDGQGGGGWGCQRCTRITLRIPGTDEFHTDAYCESVHYAGRHYNGCVALSSDCWLYDFNCWILRT